MSEQYVVTIDQWEDGDEGVYGIFNIMGENMHECDIFNEGEDVKSYAAFMLGVEESRIKLYERPFNPYGDGRTWDLALTD